MERLRSLIPVVVLLSVGCTTLSKSTTELTQTVQKAMEPEKPPPATEFDFAFANKLQPLPDPSRMGEQRPGLVGQVFLYYHENKQVLPAKPTGELTFYVTDETPRHDGSKPATAEAWHFTADVLQKMIVDDERFGPSVAVFLPWPEEWKDVNRLTIQARYDQPDINTPIWATKKTLTLDFSMTNGATAGGVVPGNHRKLHAVPDPKLAIQQMKQNQNSLPVNGAWTAPVTPTAAPTPPPAMPPVQPGEDVRFVIPRR